NEDRIELRKITSGIANARLTEVRDGLAEGETVVAKAAAFLRAGDRVRPIMAAAPADKKVEEAER
ncbi:MAG: efflux RND transporter periplasmic adaptor subunit, partial [Hyphomicrobiales bacterium]|nr:efflux RND transporter periplasmic adaptor subunit [Hyphomicrobiales bacterium]